ncbi:MAG TPA: oligosaccharide flippase family protein [Thermoanaerobaculia bacterium]|nr:oligosaccharide flippase family protein [Thermoanaerobaculia bacterium]
MRRNLVANVAGTAWSGLLTLALVPLYVRFLGTEGYALIGFYTSLFAVVVLLDFGLGLTVNRELSRLSLHDDPRRRALDVLRAAEVVHWAIALIAGALLYVAAPWLAVHWLDARTLAPGAVTVTLRFTAAALACRFPYGVYAAALLGLQRHVSLNAVLIAMSTVRAAGVIVLLFVVAADVRMVMAWEAGVALLQTLLAATIAYRALPHGTAKPRLHWPVLREGWSFARTVAVIGVLSALVSQIDKLVVSRLLPLAEFGAYAVAVTIGGVIATIAVPIQATIFPRFSRLVASGNDAELRRAFRSAAQLFAVTVLPAAAIAAIFSRELITLWTRNAALANEVRWTTALIATGSALFAAMSIPYALQLARGWLTPSVIKTLGSVILLVPATIWGVARFGAVGAATAWLIVNALALAYDVTATLRRL